MIFWNILPRDDNIKLTYNTYHLALKNIAQKYNIDYEYEGMKNMEELRNFTFRMPDTADAIFFLSHHSEFTKWHSDKLLEKCPNAKIVVTGSDTVYYGVEAVTQIHCDLFIETVKEQVRLLSEKVPSEHIYWTISEDIINEAKKYSETTKIVDGICLARGTYDRNLFFSRLSSLGNRIYFNINELNMDNVYKRFAESKFTIGVSSSCQGFGNGNKRSAKGMRDWIGIFSNSLLIYDDFPDIKDIDCIPIYDYLNANSCHQLMTKLSNDSILYYELLEKQKTWLLENSMEKQLEKILLKHKLINEINI